MNELKELWEKFLGAAPSVAVAARSGPASPRTAAGSDVLPPAEASSSGHASPAAPGLHQPLLQAGQRPVLNPSRQTHTPPQIPQVVGQQTQRQPHLVRAKTMTRKAGHLYGLLPLLDPLLRRPALVIEPHYRPTWRLQIGHDEPHSREQLPGMELHLCHYSSCCPPTGGLVEKALVSHDGFVTGPPPLGASAVLQRHAAGCCGHAAHHPLPVVSYINFPQFAPTFGTQRLRWVRFLVQRPPHGGASPCEPSATRIAPLPCRSNARLQRGIANARMWNSVVHDAYHWP